MSLKTGHLQTITHNPTTQTLLITDKIYGSHTITEQILISLLLSPELTRLQGVCQHGLSGLLNLAPTVTRYEHSVGAFLLVRKVGASLEEQIAALLHDVSHTALSHVIDWALSRAGESYHEVHKGRFLEGTGLPSLLRQAGIDLSVFDEERYPLVEIPAPRLCADRLDYALRDTVTFGKLGIEDAKRVYDALTVFPDPGSRERVLVLRGPGLALVLARAYQAADRDVWSNEAHVDMYRRAGGLIGELVRGGVIAEEALWSTDREFWALLREKAGDRVDVLDRLESEGVPRKEGLRLPLAAKVRTIDPDVLVGEVLLPLSVERGEWAVEREQYVRRRQAMRE